MKLGHIAVIVVVVADVALAIALIAKPLCACDPNADIPSPDYYLAQTADPSADPLRPKLLSHRLRCAHPQPNSTCAANRRLHTAARLWHRVLSELRRALQVDQRHASLVG